MTTTIRIGNDVLERLKKLAEPFVDTPSDVIARVLTFYEQHQPRAMQTTPAVRLSVPTLATNASEIGALHGKQEGKDGFDFSDRMPRDRGACVKIDGKSFEASSVADLYSQVLRYLCGGGYIERLKQHLPIATSGQRYILAREPVHPHGNEFVRPVRYEGYYMEAHKPWNRALEQLQGVLRRVGLSVEYKGESKFS